MAREPSTLRYVVYFLGTLLFLLLIAGLALLVVLLVREVRLNERQSNFVSAVTHELKTPVASLRLYLDTLELRNLPESRRDDFYRTMRQDLDRLNATINNVLNAAMYTDRPVAEAQPLDLVGLVRRSIDLTRRRHQLPREAIAYAGPDRMRINGDVEALETAVLNLLDNAVKYSKEPSLARVEVELAATDGLAHLRVRDHGIGMSRAHLRFIFNRFYRIGREVRRSHTGTGLGLFIVKSVVKGHRGTMAADSPGPGEGSTFTVTLPGVLEAGEGEGAEEADGHGWLLIVEDEKNLAKGMKFNFELEGYDVDVLEDGAEALARLTGPPIVPPYDLIVLDVMLPGLDGFAVADRVRKAGNFVPILILTAKSLPADVVHGLEVGADDYLAKPFDLAVLLARVKGLLRRRDWARGSAGELERARIGDLDVDFRTFEIRKDDTTIHLTLLEAMLLKLLVQNAGRVVSKGEILEKVWNVAPDTETRAVDNFIVRLRRYIEPNPRFPTRLLTVRGAGYRLVLP